MVRLYVGGLPADIKQPELTARFTPFGQVAGCEVVPAKGLDATPGCCRGFAYVDLTPKDEQALSRCLSLVRSRQPGGVGCSDSVIFLHRCMCNLVGRSLTHGSDVSTILKECIDPVVNTVQWLQMAGPCAAC